MLTSRAAQFLCGLLTLCAFQVPAQAQTELPASLAKRFTRPTAQTDPMGNPVTVRDGKAADPESGLPFEIWLKDVSIPFVLVPAGEFRMGSMDDEAGHEPDEGPVRTVRITHPFYLAKYEITQGQWRAVLGTGPAHFAKAGDDAPVESISWTDAEAFCEKAGLTLPTEAQWEMACRAGGAEAFGDRDALTRDMANFNGDKTRCAGFFKPNALGLYDMHGNVSEWCRDVYVEGWYGHADTPSENPLCLQGGERRVHRGGSWKSPASDCRCANRFAEQRFYRDPSVGFRPAFDIPVAGAAAGSPSAVVKAFCEAFLPGGAKWDVAMNLFTPKAQEFLKLIMQIEADGGPKFRSYEILKETVEGDQATVRVTTKEENRPGHFRDSTEDLKLRNVDGAWKVFGITEGGRLQSFEDDKMIEQIKKMLEMMKERQKGGGGK